MELSVQKYIREKGLGAAIDEFKLIIKDYPHKVLLKYSQIESPRSAQEVHDSRGLVLEKDTWNVMSLAFRKFFNLGEGIAATIDWSTARVFKKLDGTMIQAYHDWVKDDVYFGTTGTAEGEGNVDNFHHNVMGGTFSDLFIHAFIETTKEHIDIEKVTKMHHLDQSIFVKTLFVKYSGYTLTFELCTPYNIVVTPHSQSKIYLLGGRDVKTLQEVSYDKLKEISEYLKVPLAPSFPIVDEAGLTSSFEGMPYHEEGYVVCDGSFNRIKVKNPAYLAVHFMKDETAFWRVVDIVRSGEVGEFLATFPHREEELLRLESNWEKLIVDMNLMLEDLKNSKEYNIFISDKNNKLARKDVALLIQEKIKTSGLRMIQGFFFTYINDPSKDIKTYLRELDGKELYQLLNKK